MSPENSEGNKQVAILYLGRDKNDFFRQMFIFDRKNRDGNNKPEENKAKLEKPQQEKEGASTSIFAKMCPCLSSLKKKEVEEVENGKAKGKDTQFDNEKDQDEKEIIFLRQFPQMSYFFKENRKLVAKARKKKQKLFQLSEGGWQKPTCCSLLINLAQALVTINSIMTTKGNIQMYWVPQIYRERFLKNFYNVND